MKTYRTDGATYSKKCENIVLRIQSVFTNVKPENLQNEDINKIKLIKELITAEEIFAQSAADYRDPQKWMGSVDD